MCSGTAKCTWPSQSACACTWSSTPLTATARRQIWAQLTCCARREVVFGRVLVNRELHTAQSERSCLHVELDISGSGLTYEAGDHVGILPNNDPALVEEAAALLGQPLDTVFNLAVPVGNPNDLSTPFKGARLQVGAQQRQSACHEAVQVQAAASARQDKASSRFKLDLCVPAGDADDLSTPFKGAQLRVPGESALWPAHNAS